jgi:hypothetical protein
MLDGPVLLVEDDVSDFRLIQRAFAKIKAGVPMIRLTQGDEAPLTTWEQILTSSSPENQMRSCA